MFVTLYFFQRLKTFISFHHFYRSNGQFFEVHLTLCGKVGATMILMQNERSKCTYIGRQFSYPIPLFFQTFELLVAIGSWW